MDIDYNENVESTNDEAHDVVMQEANEDDSSSSMNDDNIENDEVDNVLVGNSDEEFQIYYEDNAEQFEIDNDEHADEDYEEEQEVFEDPDTNVNMDDDDTFDDDQSHFPRLFSPELGEGDDPYLSDSAVEHRSVWVYTIDMQRHLDEFSELSAKQAQKKKKARSEEHARFWADKKQHGLEDIKDRLERFSGDKATGKLQSFSDEQIEDMEKFLVEFDLSFLNSQAYYNEASHEKVEEDEYSIAPSSPPSSNLPHDMDEEVDRLLLDKNFTCNSAQYQLRSRDLHTLNPTRWLNDNVMNAYISLLSSTTPPNITIVPSFINSAIRTARTAGMSMRKNEALFRLTKPYPNLMSSLLILMPINIGNTHWIAGAINLPARTLTLYDSSQSVYQNHYEDIFWGIQNWLVNEGKRRQQEMSNLKLIAPQITVPQQLNSYDCGLFTLNFILACAQGKDEFPFDQSNCSQLRRKMCWELANEPLDQTQSYVFKGSSVNVEKQDISTSSTPVSSGHNEKHQSTDLEPSHSAAPLDLQLDLDQEIDELLLREVEDINLDPDADLNFNPYAKEDLEPQSEPLGHVTSQGLNIASVKLRSSGLTDAVRCDDPGVQ
ncbi:hypothetical protein F5050DRAFT_1852134 [Lentinula boryana]|uniref:Ubiquitin-like protease family profile domain-containing protein n=1 Tax=Lentinula boryana TaxID=40481 RepID=A0ABQ8Q3D7_9AGAR|nr:hypothetical protein F5050DRAFT_1852134 [Lentinula boryana]